MRDTPQTTSAVSKRFQAVFGRLDGRDEGILPSFDRLHQARSLPSDPSRHTIDLRRDGFVLTLHHDAAGTVYPCAARGGPPAKMLG